MLTYVRTSLFDSPAQTLVNTVNLVGVMGKGVALEFKSRYPDMFKAYRSLCDQHALEIGKLHLWRATDHWILNFPTKTTWKKPSKLDYIEAGLDVFLSSYRGMGISSISFPPLGCGNGNLSKFVLEFVGIAVGGLHGARSLDHHESVEAQEPPCLTATKSLIPGRILPDSVHRDRGRSPSTERR